MSAVQLAKTWYDPWDVAIKVAVDKLESAEAGSVWETLELVVEIEYLCGHWSWYRYRSWLRWHHVVVMMHGHVGAIGYTSGIV